MDLPLAGVFFPEKFHAYFPKSKPGFASWNTLLDLEQHTCGSYESIHMISGTIEFIKQYVPGKCEPDFSIVCVEVPLRGVHRHRKARNRRDHHKSLVEMGLTPITFVHSSYGGATDADHIMAFGAKVIPSGVDIYSAPADVPRCIKHFLNDATEGKLDVRLQAPGDQTQVPLRKVSLCEKTRYVKRDGLFPSSLPSCRVICPSVFLQQNQWCARKVSFSEACRLYSIPASYDKRLDPVGDAGWRSQMPFEDSISADILATIFRQMWGSRLGGSATVEVKSSCVDDPQAVGVNVVESVVEFEPMIARSADTSSDQEKTPRGSCPDLLSPLIIPVFPAPADSLKVASEDLKFSKAVKADEAAVPVHLWDDKVAQPPPCSTPVCNSCKAAADKVLHDLKIYRDNPDNYKVAAANVLREWGLKIFRRSLLRDCTARLRKNFNKTVKIKSKSGVFAKKRQRHQVIHWYDTKHNPRRTKDGKVTPITVELYAMTNVLWHAAEATWFEYPSGSQLNYFRFPPFYQVVARDGVRVHFEKKGPDKMSMQRPIQDETLRERVKKKLEKVVNRRYVVEAVISLKSLIKYFPVEKGEDDIRMVYDATANELNDAVWVPSFWLPTVESMLRSLDENSWMMDCDIGEQFLNYPLHKDVWPYTGLDFGPILSEKDLEDGKARWYHWIRMLMGFKPSPYIAVKMTLIAEEVVRGDRHDEENPFHWTTTRTNLPGSADYDPGKSWIAKIRKDGRLAADLFTFVDDERVMGPDEDITWKAGHRLGYIQAYLGIQNAARKLRACTQTPGAWAGSVVHVLPEFGVCVLTSPEKWNKLRDILRKWLDRIDSGEEKLDHKELLSDRGFLVYVTRTYPAMVPYLKGFHLTIENWRENRDVDGWKITSKGVEDETRLEEIEEAEDEAAVNHKMEEDLQQTFTQHAPEDGLTKAAPRFREDLLSLMKLSNFELPPLRLVRGKVVFTAVYGFGDASGKGFGSTVGDGKKDVSYRMGIWGKDIEDESSNYRELRNLVETAEEEARKGNLSNTEFFLFTDNSTAESAFHRNNSSSKLLHALILRLRMLEVEHSVIIHLIHVSGKRMMAQGTDGCSRGARLEGVMAGESMLSFIPLHETAIERHPPLLDWVRSWTGRDQLNPLSTDDWFERAHGIIGGQLDDNGIWMPLHEKGYKLHLWAPPPAIADVALEELLKARHKRTDTYHVLLFPRLMLPRWRRLFNKACDLSFSVQPNRNFWPESMHEPLWVGVVLPFTLHRPWQLGRAPLVVDMEGELCQMFREGQGDGRDILCKLLSLPRRLAKVSASVACGMLHMPGPGKISSRRTGR